VKHKGRAEDVKELVKDPMYGRVAKTMGELDQVAAKARGSKDEVFSHGIRIEENLISGSMMRPKSEWILPASLMRFINDQGRAKELLNSTLNSIDKMYKRLMRDYTAMCFGKPGGFLYQVQQGGFKVFLTLWREKPTASLESLMSAEAPRLTSINTTLILVGLAKDVYGNRVPDFSRVGVLCKKVVSGSLKQVKLLLAHMDSILSTPVCVFYSNY
jgi:hypothetical protein